MFMPKNPNALLHDIARTIAVVEQATRTQNWVAYSSNEQLQFVVERALTIIGEAMVQIRRLSPSMAEQFTDYKRIISFRNILVHGYADLDQEIVWKVVQVSLPVLKTEVEGLLKNPKP